ncbi:MAG TPA: VWA domain-containing protein [Thermoanaerobaculia bacterium]|nr:VWA domain-containing protein [Thermoanaerobaculia bacterium]
MRCLGRVAFLFLLTTSAASAQLNETIDVHLVEVPVTVIDRAGNPVRGLTAANFQLFDRGAKRPIANFETIDFESEAARAASPLNPAARRNWVLLFDLSFSSPVGRSKAQEAARNFIARGMGWRDLAAVATIDVDRGFRMVTSLTTDRNLLGAAIANPRTFVSADPLRIAGSTVLEAPPTDGISRADVNAVDDFAVDIARGEKKLNDQYNRTRIERQLRLLADLGRTLRVLPGRKQVILFSEGFDPRLVRGRDARASADEQDDTLQTTSGNIWRVDTDARYGSSMTMTLLDEMGRSLRGSDIVLHAVDIQGVRVQNDEHGSSINSNDALHLLSRPTGGEVFKNSNDINADLQKMLHAQDVVYVLGFRAPATKDNKFHELTVRVNGVPGARVFHRAGYYESGDESALERSLSNAEIVLNDIAQNDIRVAALAAAFPARSGRAQVPVVVDIGADGLLRDAKTNAVVTEIYVYAFDDQGVVRDRSYQRLTIDGAKMAGHNGVKYFLTLSLEPGKYALKTLVRVIGTEHKGFVRTDINVPASYDVTLLPPMFLDDPSAWLVVRGTSHDDAATFPFHINGEPFMPSASAQVSNGHPREVALFVFNVDPDELSWEAAVTDANGSHAETPSVVKRLRGQDVMKLVFEYAPTDLQTGPASFDVTVHKKGSSDARKSSVPLVVQ